LVEKVFCKGEGDWVVEECVSVIIRKRFGRKRWRSEGWERRSSVREKEIGWWRSL
jgi:hypothetical protein